MEEQTFSTGNKDMVVYLELGGIERKGWIGTKGRRIRYLACRECEKVRRCALSKHLENGGVRVRFIQTSC